MRPLLLFAQAGSERAVLERVVHEARGAHRLDRGSHRQPERPDAVGEATQTVTVRRRRELTDQLTIVG